MERRKPWGNGSGEDRNTKERRGKQDLQRQRGGRDNPGQTHGKGDLAAGLGRFTRWSQRRVTATGAREWADRRGLKELKQPAETPITDEVKQSEEGSITQHTHEHTPALMNPKLDLNPKLD